MSSLYLFNRSLRLPDNKGILHALSESKKVYPVFCVDPRQATPKKNKYFSSYALGFMLQSLRDLQKELKKYGSDLLVLKGKPEDILPRYCEEKKISMVYLNEDYTPFARKRFHNIVTAFGEDSKTRVEEVPDHLLHSAGSITTTTGSAYKVYTSFLHASMKKRVEKPVPFKGGKKLASKRALGKSTGWRTLEKHSSFSPPYTPGGRTEALKRLKSLPKTQKRYKKCRDYLTYKTTRLSAYIKFGCISIREAWYGFGKVFGESSVSLKRELIWREFYYHYYIAYPEELEWDRRARKISLEEKAPDLVKACDQQLNQSGYLHNRGRMILATYILHEQGEYWKEGDRYYATRLVDYDPIVNIGNWRWIEKQPPFKRIKPKTQVKWDRTCPGLHNKGNQEKGVYVKKWLGD